MSFYLFFIAALVVLGTLLSPTLFVLLLVAMAALALVTSTVCRSSNKLPWQKLLISALALSYGFGWLHWQLAYRLPIAQDKRSEERRVGKECRSRRSRNQKKKK